MRRVGLTFVHGINNGPRDRAGLRDKVLGNFRKFGIDNLFSIPGTEDHYVNAASWESTGDFFLDLAALLNAEWREYAIKSVGSNISYMQDKLLQDASMLNGEMSPVHIILMHSMGQPLGISAVADLTHQKKLLIPTFIISIGGPLGSRNPMYKSYLKWCTKRISWYNPSKSLAVKEWIDIYNPDDPICYAPALGIFGSGYAPVRGVTKSLSFDWRGRPPAALPLSEHSSYFEGKILYDTIASCVKPTI